VIEDACQAHGATYKGKKSGSMGDLAGFSLNSWKNLPAGDGGLFVTNDEDFYENALMVREFGERIYKGKRREYNAYAMGWMYRTTEFVGAFARSQLKRLDAMNKQRIENTEMLSEGLKQYDFVSLPGYRTDRTCVHWFYAMMLSAQKAGFGHISDFEFRDKVSEALYAEGVRAGSWQRHTLPGQSIFHDKVGYGKGSPWTDSHYKGNVTYNPEEYPVAQSVVDRSLWLSNLYFWPSGEKQVKAALEGFDKVFTQLGKLF